LKPAEVRPPDLAPAPGVGLWLGWLDRPAQEALAARLREIALQAPLFTPVMPRDGKPFSVRMTNCGPLGWVSDRSGYRYQPRHPETGRPWPPIPDVLLLAWRALSGCPVDPDACLVNYYGVGAKMGLHQDRDEATFEAPILSLSLGDEAVFRLGGASRRDPTRSFRLRSGDALAFGGPARLAFHGIDRVIAGSSTLLPKGGRINLTLRRVAPFAKEADGSAKA
jgi:alkylated DNA repair protein (DNA oxidative demethylase)